MMEESIVVELSNRIEREINFYGGKLPDNVALAWNGYLAGIFEWEIIDLKDYDNLLKMLPIPTNNPVYSIFTGTPGSHLELE